MNSLGSILRQTKDIFKASLSDLTVLSPQNDPFRLDTPANHTKGRWFRDMMEACGLFKTATKIHNRGIHYAIVSLGSACLPDGTAYVNNADCWAYLEDASNTARWLGYVPWEKIFDARNADPIIHIAGEPEQPEFTAFYGGAGLGQTLLDAADVITTKPSIGYTAFEVRQPYHLVFYGEKTSLSTVLEPLARRHGADLYLPSGEISNTLLATMAKSGEADGREMVVFIFADCDPAGYQMSVSIGHKLRAMQEGLYPGLQFQLFAPCLTVEQVRSLRLPSTPLKETELRAAGWRERYGVEQTEIDALATLQPDAFRNIVIEAVAPFFDAGLQERTAAALRVAVAAAQEEFDQQIDAGEIRRLQLQARREIELLQTTLDEIRLAIDAVDIEIARPDVSPLLPPITPNCLVSSDMHLFNHIKTLKERKDYSGGAN